jgi:hypothetical protein
MLLHCAKIIFVTFNLFGNGIGRNCIFYLLTELRNSTADVFNVGGSSPNMYLLRRLATECPECLVKDNIPCG